MSNFMSAQDEDHVFNLLSRTLGSVCLVSYPPENARGMTFKLDENLTDEGIQYGEDLLKTSGVTLEWHSDTTFTATFR